MALKKSYSVIYDVTAYPNAYHRVTRLSKNLAISGDSDPASYADIFVSVYVDENNRDVSSVPVNITFYRCAGSDFQTYFATSVLDSDGTNGISQAYDYLKASVEYYMRGTEDV